MGRSNVGKSSLIKAIFSRVPDSKTTRISISKKPVSIPSILEKFGSTHKKLMTIGPLHIIIIYGDVQHE